MDCAGAHELLRRVEEQVRRAVIGQDEAVRLVLATAAAGGHALLEGVPGTAKTLLVRTLARTFDCRFRRVQFTPDLMPADITGLSIPAEAHGEFVFRPGPVFTDFLLADEINRSPAKTQAALLEAMQERQVSADGRRHDVGDLFTVFATQNPVEYEGTYRLPEAELDRFLVKARFEYPSAEDEDRILALLRDDPAADAAGASVDVVAGADDLRAVRAAVRSVRVEDRLLSYLRTIVAATRGAASLSMGAGPRGSVSLLRAAQASAVLEGRDFATPDDVKSMAPAVLRHRLLLNPEFEIEGVAADDVVAEILKRTEAPR